MPFNINDTEVSAIKRSKPVAREVTTLDNTEGIVMGNTGFILMANTGYMLMGNTECIMIDTQW